jgi:PAS domain S-box-containing protein
MTYRRLATASALIPLAFALLGLAAWITGRLRLASLRTEFIPMAPTTAVVFVLVSAALIAVAFGQGTTMRNAVRAAACLVFIFACVGHLEFETAFIGQFGTFGAVPLARMSPLTATTFALIGLALGCLTNARTQAVRDLGGVLGSLALLMGSTVALGYAYGAPLLYGGTVIPMALTTGLAFMGTGVALVALAGPTSLPLRPFSQGAIKAALAETERKRAEKALAESQGELKAIFDAAPDGILIAETESGRFQSANASICRMLGYSHDEMLNLGVSDLHRKEDAAHGVQEFERHAKWNSAVSADQPLKKKDGSIFFADINSAPVTLGGKRFLVGIIRDVTERKRAEEALRQGEILSSSLVEHLPQRIFVKDRNSHYVFCNSPYALDLGIEQKQIVGKDDFAFFPQKLAEAYRADDRTVMADGTIKDLEERYEGAGETRWIHTTKVPYRDGQGEIIGVLGIFDDITDRKRAEEELKHHNDDIQLHRLRVFRATMRTVQDIVNNLLNGLQLVHLEAEAAPPAEKQTLVGQVIQEAAVKLKSLGDLETIQEREMAIGLGIDYPGAAS